MKKYLSGIALQNVLKEIKCLCENLPLSAALMMEMLLLVFLETGRTLTSQKEGSTPITPLISPLSGSYAEGKYFILLGQSI